MKREKSSIYHREKKELAELEFEKRRLLVTVQEQCKQTKVRVSFIIYCVRFFFIFLRKEKKTVRTYPSMHFKSIRTVFTVVNESKRLEQV